MHALESGKIEEVEIRAGSGDVTSLKKQNDRWQIVVPTGIEVDEAEVSSIVTTLESLEVQRVLEENPTTVAPFGLEPARFSIGFKVAGETAMRRFLAGKKTPTGGELYARVEGQPKLFLISAYLEESLNKTTFDLRDKTVLKFDREAVDALTLESAGAPAAGARRRRASEWRFTKPTDARADFSAVDGIVGPGVLGADESHRVGGRRRTAELKKYGLDKPQAVATIGAGIDARVARDRREAGRHGGVRPRPVAADGVHSGHGAARRAQEESPTTCGRRTCSCSGRSRRSDSTSRSARRP